MEFVSNYDLFEWVIAVGVIAVLAIGAAAAIWLFEAMPNPTVAGVIALTEILAAAGCVVLLTTSIPHPNGFMNREAEIAAVIDKTYGVTLAAVQVEDLEYPHNVDDLRGPEAFGSAVIYDDGEWSGVTLVWDGDKLILASTGSHVPGAELAHTN